MNTSKSQVEFQNVLSEGLCKEALIRIFYVTQQKRRRSTLIVAMIEFVFFVCGFLYSSSIRMLEELLLSVGCLLGSAVCLYLYFWAYSFPRSRFVKRIQKMSTPNERQYVFFEDRVEENTDQSTRTVMFSQITMIIHAKNVLVLLADNTQIILSNKCIPGNYEDFLSFLQKATNAKCVE